MSENKDFKWTDALVKKFANELFIDKMADDQTLAEFKASHSTVEEKGCGWEIVEGKHKNGVPHEWIKENNKIGSTPCLERGCKIHSVKRISDGEVFTVGDSVVRNNYTDSISYFEISGNEMMVGFSANVEVGWFNISDLQKAHKKQPLFTTEDGFSYYGEPIQLWYVEPDRLTSIEIYAPNYWSPEKCEKGAALKKLKNKWFSTKEAADEYVLLNKECLSLNDLLSVWGGVEHTREIYKQAPLFNNFKELANKKLKIN